MMLRVFNAMSFLLTILKGQVMHFYWFPQCPDAAKRNSLSQKQGGRLLKADLYLKTSLFLTELIMVLPGKLHPNGSRKTCLLRKPNHFFMIE